VDGHPLRLSSRRVSIHSRLSQNDTAEVSGSTPRGRNVTDSQVGGLALLDVFALAARGALLAAQRARDAHQQAAATQEEAADVHQHQEQQQRSQAQAHHRAQAHAAEQGFC